MVVARNSSAQMRQRYFPTGEPAAVIFGAGSVRLEGVITLRGRGLFLLTALQAVGVAGIFARGIHTAGEIQVTFRVCIANVSNHRADEAVVIRNFSVLNVASDQVAQYAPEIFVTR